MFGDPEVVGQAGVTLRHLVLPDSMAIIAFYQQVLPWTGGHEFACNGQRLSTIPEVVTEGR